MRGAATRTILAFAALVFTASGIRAQSGGDSILEQRALHRFMAGEFASAAQDFEELTQTFSSSPKIHSWNLYRGIARYNLDQFPEATALFLKVLQSRSDADLLSRAHFYLANIAYRTGDNATAVHRYILAFSLGTTELSHTTLASITTILSSVGDEIEIQIPDLIAIESSDKRCEIVSVIATVAASNNQTEIIDRLKGLCDTVMATTKKPAHKPTSEYSLAVMLPLTGELADYGNELLQGIQTAVQSHDTWQSGLNLNVFDTEGDASEAARLVKQIASSPDVAVIGPLTSEEASAVSAMSSSLNVPVIVPAAAQTDFVSLSHSVYQLTPAISQQGKRMARYAQHVIKADSAVVISLNSPDARRVADVFAEEFQKNGGIIVARQYVHPRDKDFGPVIRDIKRICGIREFDSLAYVDASGDTLSSDAIPLNIDCLFIASEPEQLRLLLPQLHFYNVHGQLLGTDAWGSKEVLGLDPDIVNGAVFASALLAGSDNPAYQRFRLAYKDLFDAEPTHLSALGYDACNLVMGSAQKLTRSAVAETLSSLTGYRGASGRVDLTQDRSNSELPIFEIQSGQTREKNPTLVSDEQSGK